MIFGISATHVTQLVAQKLTSVTLPLRSAVRFWEPSRRTKVDAGATSLPPHKNAALTSAQADRMAASAQRLFDCEEFVMDRRQFNSVSLAVAVFVALATQKANALSLGDLSNADASKGLKAALEKGALSAVNALGATDGFLGNEKVRIQLPAYLQDAANLMRTFGQGTKVDELITAMNRGAEAAVPMAKELLMKAVQTMSLQDAKGILAGSDTAVTEFFASKTRPALAIQFLPAVTKATASVGLVDKYNQVAGKAAEVGLIKKEDANIQQYVTGKALDGLFFMISEEEKKIRQNPAGFGSSILTKVFGALK
jgi:Protein of unknown function (DUF4197)